MEIAVINHKGQDTGRKVTLSDEIFAIEPNDNAIYLDVKLFTKIRMSFPKEATVSR